MHVIFLIFLSLSLSLIIYGGVLLCGTELIPLVQGLLSDSVLWDKSEMRSCCDGNGRWEA